MRLLYTITAYPPSIGGAQLHLHELVTHLDSHQVDVISQWDQNRSDWLLGTTLRAPTGGRSYEIDGVPVHRLGLGARARLRAVPAVLGYYLATGWAASRLADQLRPYVDPLARHADVVHCVRVGREPLALASADAARRAGQPFVFTPLHHPRWTKRRHRLYIDLYRRADATIALTEAERSELVALGARPEAVFVTGIGPILAPNADPDRFRRRHALDGPLVLFLGQHFRYKGYLSLLAAAPLVWARVPEARFVFAGPPVGRSDHAFRGADRRIHRLGAVDLQTKTDALAACEVVCVPSTQESFGGVFTEAWSFGKPVVGGDIPAVRQVVDAGVDGFLVGQHPAEIAERIVYLLEHPAVAERMGARGRAKVVDRYSWPALAAKTEGIYRSLM
jgi:glycosyltransferase involved in cell wall biosynthesis